MDNSPIRILLIDDDEDDYVVTRRMLGQMEDGRLALEWSATTDAALEQMERYHYDLYLLDYQLGKDSGLRRAAGSAGAKLQGALYLGVAVADPLQPLSLEALMNKADQHLYDQKRVRKRLSSQGERAEGEG